MKPPPPVPFVEQILPLRDEIFAALGVDNPGVFFPISGESAMQAKLLEDHMAAVVAKRKGRWLL